MRACVVFLMVFSLNSFAQAMQGGIAIAKNEDGSLRKMVHSSRYLSSVGISLADNEIGAVEYCENLNAHLPGSGSLYGGYDEGKVPAELFWTGTFAANSNEYASAINPSESTNVLLPRDARAAVLCVPN